MYDLLERQKCTITAAVPTVWLALLQHLQDHDVRLSTLKISVIGGSAAPLSMIKAIQDGTASHIAHLLRLPKAVCSSAGRNCDPGASWLTGLAGLALLCDAGATFSLQLCQVTPHCYTASCHAAGSRPDVREWVTYMHMGPGSKA